MGGVGNKCSLKDFEDLNKPQSQSHRCMDTTLRLCLLGSPTPRGSGTNSNKRKWSDVNASEYPEDGFGSALGLVRSASTSEITETSSNTIFTMSGKESSKRSAMDLLLDIQLRLGNDGMPSPKDPALDKVKASETGDICDLQLSLSAGPSTSVITAVSPFSGNKNSLDASASVNEVAPVDEGSTSSRWTAGIPMLPTVGANQPVHGFNLTRPEGGKLDPVPSVPYPLEITTPQEQKSSTSWITQKQHPRNTSTRICRFQGCGKGARGASGLCIAHGGGKRCQKEGCNKGAEGRTPYCKAHGGGRRCQSLGCTKSAEGRTNFCIAHGGGRRCSHEGCSRAARGKSGLCIRHGGGKRCQWENCTKSAEGYSGLCISHGGGRRCQFPACTKGAQGSTMFCKAHGGGKRCTALGCTKGAEGSTLFCKGHGGGKRCLFQGGGICPKSVHGGTQFCVAHGGGKRCAVPGCTKSARGRTDFCVRHGGGKRCKFEGCGKSAQGRTDFCKAHGGGKRCSWVQAGSPNLEYSGGQSCDRFARGKSGLCTAHSVLTKDHAVHGGIPSDACQNILPSSLENLEGSAAGNSSANVVNHGWNLNMQQTHGPQPSAAALPEGRVHGGNLMAILASGAGLSSPNKDLAKNDVTERIAAHIPPHKWM